MIGGFWGNGVDIVMYFPDPGVSGLIDPVERSVFRSMIDYAKKNGVKAIVF